MNAGKQEMFRNRLTKVLRHLGRQAKRLGVSCYRLYDHDLPEFPFCIEWYEENVYVAEYKRRHGMTEDAHDAWISDCIETICQVLQVAKEKIFLKLRQRKPGRLGQYQKFDKVQHEFEVNESGLKFIVNLSDYLDTGLFLDHRVTRQLVQAKAGGMRVLNLFAYTGSFSVYAAAGGASSVTTVDLSKTYLDWAARNMALNEYADPEKYLFLQADVMQYLPTLASGTFDIIILDPPTFSNSKRMKDFLDVQRDHVFLINECLRLLDKGGEIFFSTNYQKFSLDQAAITPSSIRDLTRMTTPFDFEGRLKRVCYQISR